MPIVAALLCAMPVAGSAQESSEHRLHTDLPALNENAIVADVHYQFKHTTQDTLTYSCYKFNAANDSILIAAAHNIPLRAGGEAGTLTIRFDDKKYPAAFNATYLAILRKTGSTPPGSYKVFLRSKVDSTPRQFVHVVDSNLTATSSIRKELNQTLIPQKTSILGVDVSRQAGSINNLAKNTTKTLDRANRRLERLFKSKGLSSTTEKRDGKEYISLYFENWFVGRYEAQLSESLNSQMDKQKSQLTGPIANLANTELEGYRSLLSQVKDLTKQKKEEREINGEIGVTGNWANAQPEYGEQDNNFYEVRGRVETKVRDIPVSVEGYYTTQDKHRQIKGSYIRVHYDAEKAKSELMELIGGFKNQAAQTVSKGKGLEQVYGSYLNNLSNEKNGLLSDLKKETGLSDINTSTFDTAGLQQQITESLKSKIVDTAAADGNNNDTVNRLRTAKLKAARTADSANKIYQKALKKYQRLVALEQTGRKYYALVEQYRNTNYFDSTLGYDKLKNLDGADAMTYKELAKSASGLLPEGKVKKFATGLTNMDLGIFPKQLSQYTMAGQQMKGIDVGYDLGFCQVGATYGSTEFAGRDGSLDKYAAYSGRAVFTPLKDQKINLVYYGYSPSKSAMARDTFFRDIDIAAPTFKEPVHIVSVAYMGRIAGKVNVEGEIASSFQSGTQLPIRDQLDAAYIAWQLHADGTIPKTAIHLDAGYEHGGTSFKNSTLPVNISGLDLLKLGAKSDLFKSFLTLGIEYNHIRQQSYYGTGNNNRWGFEIATHSKQYPSVTLSYKPYTTFRSYTDTLNIPQRPLVGAVWTGKATYQFKKIGGRSWRFSAIYNKSTSEIDTTAYGSNLVQVMAIYTTKKWTLNASAGNMDQKANGTAITEMPAHMRTTFCSVSGSCMMGKQVSLNGGLDGGVAKFGLSKYGLNAGVCYRMKKLPLTTRLWGRYMQYHLQEDQPWKPVYAGSVDLLWQFKMKLK